jgi:hypothetical protein
MSVNKFYVLSFHTSLSSVPFSKLVDFLNEQL